LTFGSNDLESHEQPGTDSVTVDDRRGRTHAGGGMSRLAGANGMAKAIAIATIAPGGTVAVGSALVMDEAEHYRAGIGCMLEQNRSGEVYISVVVNGGSAFHGGIREGDIIERVDEHDIRPGAGVEVVSSYIRGPIGSVVTMFLRRHGQLVKLSIPRARVPGAGTEMLGMLFQNNAAVPSAQPREPSLQDKLGKLAALRERGNLSENEFAAARSRLLSGQDSSIQRRAAPSSFGTFLNALGSDVFSLIEDPEVARRRNKQQQDGLAGNNPPPARLFL
jgi:hypothetical protein